MCSGLISFGSVWVQKQAEEFREKPERHCAAWLQPLTKEHLVASVWLLRFPPLASPVPAAQREARLACRT